MFPSVHRLTILTQMPLSCCLSRRRFLKTAAAVSLLPFVPRLRGADQPGAPGLRLTPPEEILARVASHRPLRGGLIPADFARRLGASHVSGRYHLTDEPFLVEGAKRVQSLGYGGLKLWFTKIESAYPFNSDWRLDPAHSLVELARHPYMVEAFAMPFKVFTLEVLPTHASTHRDRPGHSISPELDFEEEERQVYELATHLLSTYRERDVTFILQNWEGDWMFRGGARAEWKRGEFPELELRAATFARWIDVRQRAVERARAEAPGARCRVLHAVEVNRVFDSLEGVATVCTHVLPRVRPDLVSWSCYDGIKLEHRSGDVTAAGIWQGIEIIRHHARTTQTDAQGRAQVYLGEFGVPENKVPPEVTVDVVDGALAAAFALDLPWMVYWELYCNERKNRAETGAAPSRADELNGYWLVRPDGSLGHAAGHLQRVLAHAGGRLPANA